MISFREADILDRLIDISNIVYKMVVHTNDNFADVYRVTDIQGNPMVDTPDSYIQDELDYYLLERGFRVRGTNSSRCGKQFQSAADANEFFRNITTAHLKAFEYKKSAAPIPAMTVYFKVMREKRADIFNSFESIGSFRITQERLGDKYFTSLSLQFKTLDQKEKEALVKMYVDIFKSLPVNIREHRHDNPVGHIRYLSSDLEMVFVSEYTGGGFIPVPVTVVSLLKAWFENRGIKNKLNEPIKLLDIMQNHWAVRNGDYDVYKSNMTKTADIFDRLEDKDNPGFEGKFNLEIPLSGRWQLGKITYDETRPYSELALVDMIIKEVVVGCGFYSDLNEHLVMQDSDYSRIKDFVKCIIEKINLRGFNAGYSSDLIGYHIDFMYYPHSRNARKNPLSGKSTPKIASLSFRQADIFDSLENKLNPVVPVKEVKGYPAIIIFETEGNDFIEKRDFAYHGPDRLLFEEIINKTLEDQGWIYTDSREMSYSTEGGDNSIEDKLQDFMTLLDEKGLDTIITQNQAGYTIRVVWYPINENYYPEKKASIKKADIFDSLEDKTSTTMIVDVLPNAIDFTFNPKGNVGVGDLELMDYIEKELGIGITYSGNGEYRFQSHDMDSLETGKLYPKIMELMAKNNIRGKAKGPNATIYTLTEDFLNSL